MKCNFYVELIQVVFLSACFCDWAIINSLIVIYFQASLHIGTSFAFSTPLTWINFFVLLVSSFHIWEQQVHQLTDWQLVDRRLLKKSRCTYYLFESRKRGKFNWLRKLVLLDVSGLGNIQLLTYPFFSLDSLEASFCAPCKNISSKNESYTLTLRFKAMYVRNSKHESFYHACSKLLSQQA